MPRATPDGHAPWSGASSPATSWHNVDFPEPERPSMTTTSPAMADSDTSDRIATPGDRSPCVTVDTTTTGGAHGPSSVGSSTTRSPSMRSTARRFGKSSRASGGSCTRPAGSIVARAVVAPHCSVDITP